MADNDDLFDSTDGADDGAAGSGDGDATPPATQGDGSDATGSNSSTQEKGVAYWMSEAQKAQAALRKAQGLDQKGNPKPDAKPTPKSTDAAEGTPEAARLSEFEAFARENAREQLFNQEPRLKDFGFSLEDIGGETLAEMRANREQLVKVIDKAESRALNKAFETVGIDPALAGGPREKRDFAAMSDEEIEKEIARAKGLA